MSAEQAPQYSNTALRRMDKAEALELPKRVYDRWESLNKHLDEAETVRQEWRENEREATEILVRSDMSSVASDITLFGNEVSVYYDPEDSRIRAAAESLGDAAGIEIGDVDDIELSSEDIADDQIAAVKAALADFIAITIYSWNGHDWDALNYQTREQIKADIAQQRPDGWGLMGLLDAMNEIIIAVETHRDERLERIEKFRRPERRGDR